MASIKCETCSSDCVFKSRPKEDEVFGSACDLCQQVFCKLCAQLTTTEAHAVSLAQRNLIFFCQGCKILLKEHISDSTKYKTLLENYEKIKQESAEKDKRFEELEDKCFKETHELQDEIDELHADNKAKADHIKRINRRTQDFENIACNTEQELAAKINDQKGEILQLNQNVSNLITVNLDLDKQLKECRLTVSRLEGDLGDITETNKNMLTTIQVLSEEKKSYLEELKSAKVNLLHAKEELKTTKSRCDSLEMIGHQQSLIGARPSEDLAKCCEPTAADDSFTLINDNSVLKDCITLDKEMETARHRANASYCVPRKCIVCGDFSARSLSTTMSKLVNSSHMIKGYVYNGLNMKSLVERMFLLSFDLTENDTIVVSLNLNSTSPSIADIGRILSMGSTTNLVLMLKCNFRDYPEARFHKLSGFVSEYVQKNNCSIRLISNTCTNSRYRHTLRSLSKLLALYVETSVVLGRKLVLKSVPITIECSASPFYVQSLDSHVSNCMQGDLDNSNIEIQTKSLNALVNTPFLDRGQVVKNLT
ncbi:unnamed protein product [Ceutorhynchus assimilis]|uniref:Uncharacterized protein n=1 Tax=Ceutorhynchus assimilis TaxID=467358 RepID=A0A9N9MV35_9CUCU|nr:unnamed protein product [Ceutorhynchus assimilis]